MMAKGIGEWEPDWKKQQYAEAVAEIQAKGYDKDRAEDILEQFENNAEYALDYAEFIVEIEARGIDRAKAEQIMELCENDQEAALEFVDNWEDTQSRGYDGDWLLG